MKMNSRRTALRGQDIRKGNEKLVLRLIQQHSALSQSEVVALTGLKAPTILRIFSNLEEEDLIKIVEKPRDAVEKKGRKPVFYSLNPSSGYVVGVEFWSTSATAVVANLVREPLLSKTVDIPWGATGQEVLPILKGLIEEALEEAGLSSNEVIGIGLGAPGKVDTAAGKVVYYSRITGFRDFDLKNYFEESLGLPIFINNNCSVITMNEYIMNSESNSGPMMAILIRGGVGGAYINDGKVLTTGSVTTVELGHLSVDPRGRECSCGRRGCLETYLSEASIIEDLAGVVSVSSLGELERIRKKSTDSGMLKELENIIREKGRILAYAIQNLNSLFSPESYLIISRNKKFSEELSANVEEILREGGGSSELRQPCLIPVEYNPIMAGMGACDLVFNEYFQQDGSL